MLAETLAGTSSANAGAGTAGTGTLASANASVGVGAGDAIAAAVTRQLASAATDVNNALMSADDLAANLRASLPLQWTGVTPSVDPFVTAMSTEALRTRLPELDDLTREEQEAQRLQGNEGKAESERGQGGREGGSVKERG